MVNPFISIDQQLSNLGYVKLQEGSWGFTFAKHLGGGYCIKAECHGGYIQFFDPSLLNHDAISVNDKDLELFVAKIREWRRQYGHNPKAGRHSRKERS